MKQVTKRPINAENPWKTLRHVKVAATVGEWIHTTNSERKNETTRSNAAYLSDGGISNDENLEQVIVRERLRGRRGHSSDPSDAMYEGSISKTA